MKNTQVKERLLNLYENWENKKGTLEEIIDFIRDFYYYEKTGKSFEEGN